MRVNGANKCVDLRDGLKIKLDKIHTNSLW